MKDIDEGLTMSSWDALKVQRKYFLLFSNWINLILSIVFFIFALLLLHGFNDYPFLCYLIIQLFILRTVSRSFEITYSFYKDVIRNEDKKFQRTNISGSTPIYIHFLKRIRAQQWKNNIYVHGWKNSFLLRGERLSLAFHSILEVTLLFSVIYMFTNYFPNLTIKSQSIFGNLLDSVAISGMSDPPPDGGDNNGRNYVSMFAQVVHIIVTLTLIVLSVASYLGQKNIITEREKKLYNYENEK